MEIRIGVTYSPKELLIEMADDEDEKAIRKQATAALDGSEPVLWLTDKRGRTVGVASEKVAYIELGSGATEGRIGFGA